MELFFPTASRYVYLLSRSYYIPITLHHCALYARPSAYVSYMLNFEQFEYFNTEDQNDQHVYFHIFK